MEPLIPLFWTSGGLKLGWTSRLRASSPKIAVYCIRLCNRCNLTDSIFSCTSFTDLAKRIDYSMAFVIKIDSFTTIMTLILNTILSCSRHTDFIFAHGLLLKDFKCLWYVSGGSRISQKGGSANPWVRGKNLLFDKILAENCMKMKEIGPKARVPGAPLPGFANVHKWVIFNKLKRMCHVSIKKPRKRYVLRKKVASKK